MSNNEGFEEKTGLRGFMRLHIVDPDGTIAGDSGWQENQITDLGFRDYVVRTIGGLAGSKVITHAMLGTGGAPAAGDTALAGETSEVGVANSRIALTNATSSTSKTLNMVGTLASGIHTTAYNISNIGLINHSSTATAGTIAGGLAYTSSALASNQAVNITYNWVFATA